MEIRKIAIGQFGKMIFGKLRGNQSDKYSSLMIKYTLMLLTVIWF